ncbi:MAG: O-antigen ligase family protein [Verrucomicrobiia bacterium]
MNASKNAGRWALAVLGALVLIAPLKFSTPVVMQSFFPAPRDLWEWVFSPWPNPLLVMFVFAGLIWFAICRSDPSSRDCGIRASGAEPSKRRFDAAWWLPLLWLLTQIAATPNSINLQVSLDTLLYFAACVVAFYAAARWVRDEKAANFVFGALTVATAVACLVALQQRFGGFAATREYATAYLDSSSLSDDLRLRMTSNRVFGTLAYPNAFAGFLVVAFAPILARIWQKHANLGRIVRIALASGIMMLCLVLTGSRGGFAALAAAAVAGTLCLVRGRRIVRTMVAGVIVVIALVVVFVAAQRGGLMHWGRSSLEARLDYWNGAVRIAQDYPWLGTGPGTFGSVYLKYKTATTEEAQLVHNDYLEMWCDSGVVAFTVFVALWVVALGDAFRLARRRGDAVSVALCMALVGWVVHGLVDFDLYSPGVALPAFVLLGILRGLKGDVRQEVNHRRPLVLAVSVGLLSAVIWFEGRMLAANLAYGESRDCGTDWQAAITAAERAAALAPRNALYKIAAGELLVSEGRFAEGLEYCRQAVENDPLRARNHYRMAMALATAGWPANEVSQELRRAVELNPTKSEYREALQLLEENR